MIGADANPRPRQYPTHAHRHITRAVATTYSSVSPSLGLVSMVLPTDHCTVKALFRETAEARAKHSFKRNTTHVEAVVLSSIGIFLTYKHFYRKIYLLHIDLLSCKILLYRYTHTEQQYKLPLYCSLAGICHLNKYDIVSQQF